MQEVKDLYELKFIQVLQDQCVDDGDDVIISCTITSSSPDDITFKWFKGWNLRYMHFIQFLNKNNLCLNIVIIIMIHLHRGFNKLNNSIPISLPPIII